MTPPGKQRGSIALFAAVGIGLMVIMLSVLDIGFLTYYKREYQKAADLAAIAGANQLAAGSGSLCDAATDAARDSATANLGALLSHDPPAAECGKWTAAAFTPDETEPNAVRATITGQAPRFFMPGDRTLTATAVAIPQPPQAALGIRSTLVSLEDGLVNALLGALLGSNVSLDVLGWEGVASADVNLFDFLENVGSLEGIELSADIGTVENLLAAEVSLLNLVEATIQAVGPGSTAGVTLDALGVSLVDLGVGGLEIALGDLLSLGLGTDTAGLDVAVNAFELVQATIQTANAEHALSAGAGANVPYLAGVSLGATVIEAPQIAVVGNPARIDPANPKNGEGSIYVRTAQIRLLLSVDLGVIGLLNNVLDALPLIDVDVLGTDLDVGLNVGGAEAWVSGHDCQLDGDKSLDVDTETAAANLALGVFSPAALDDFFGSGTPFPEADVLNILSVSLLSEPVVSIGIRANVPVLGSDQQLFYENPPPEQLPEISDPETDEMYQQISSQDLVASLSDTVAGLDLETTPEGLEYLVEGVLNLVANLVLLPLGALLDPIVNALLNILGVNLAEAEVGARMSCDVGGAALVQ